MGTWYVDRLNDPARSLSFGHAHGRRSCNLNYITIGAIGADNRAIFVGCAYIKQPLWVSGLVVYGKQLESPCKFHVIGSKV